MQTPRAADEKPEGLAGRRTPHFPYWYLQVGPAALGGALLIVGCNLDHALIMDAGALTLAAAVVASGAASILTRRIVFLWPGRRYLLVAWQGGAAILIGLGFAV